MPDNKKIIDAILEHEGGATETNSPKDKGGRTKYGISEKSNPSAWADGTVTEAEAREIYEQKYIKGPGFDRIPESHPRTKELLVDWGVISGPELAKQELQGVLGVVKDGQLGPKTLQALLGIDDRSLANLIAAARIRMMGRIVKRDPSQLRWLNGWLNRALEWVK